MQRGRSKTVTKNVGMPVLIKSSLTESEGIATFLPEDVAPQTVRALRDADLNASERHLSRATAQRLTAVVMLKEALEKPGDPKVLAMAFRALVEADKLVRSGPDNPLRAAIPPDVPDNLVDSIVKGEVSGRRLIQRLEHHQGLRPGKSARKDSGWLLSYVLSAELSAARLVLWWTGEKFKPALWCPDMKTAFYARVLLGILGGKGFCICPHCGVWFIQDRPDQLFCSVSHREAHRVARWRAQQKLKGTEKGRRRGKNVTDKAR